jgi:hypothetical protein
MHMSDLHLHTYNILQSCNIPAIAHFFFCYKGQLSRITDIQQMDYCLFYATTSSKFLL